MRIELILTVVTIVIVSCFLGCGGGFEDESKDAKPFIESIMGTDSF